MISLVAYATVYVHAQEVAEMEAGFAGDLCVDDH